MKKHLLCSTALIGATIFMSGTAGAAEAPTWKLNGGAKFQIVNVDQDLNTGQDHGWYIGMGESELALNVSGIADNGLGYGFKVEIQVNTDDNIVADEARIELSGGWGKVQLGDEDGAEDVLNVGGESVMGATGGFDGDWTDGMYVNVGSAPSGPTIAGDSSDATKISYFSPNFSGVSLGISLVPTPNDGEVTALDGSYENGIGLGAKYDGNFGDVSVQASAVYAMASNTGTGEDIGAWSIGGVVGFGPFSVGAAYADNGDSLGAGIDSSYWNAAASFSSGPMAFSAGYFAGTYNAGVDEEFSDLALTADYSVAPGLGVYGEVNLLSSDDGAGLSNDGTVIIVGANVSF